MNIIQSGNNLEVTEAMRSDCVTTFERTLFQFKNSIDRIDVTYSTDGPKIKVSANVHCGTMFNSSYSAHNVHNAIGAVADGIYDVLYRTRDIKKEHRKGYTFHESVTTKRDESPFTATNSVFVFETLVPDVVVPSYPEPMSTTHRSSVAEKSVSDTPSWQSRNEDSTPSWSSRSDDSSSHSSHSSHSSWDHSSSGSSWDSGSSSSWDSGSSSSSDW